MHKWGHARVRALLAAETFAPELRGAPLAAQFSSMGSLDDKWLRQEFVPSLSAGRAAGGGTLGAAAAGRAGLQLVWPTVSEVQNSIEGWFAGHSIPGPDKNVGRPFLQPYYHRRARGVCSPHTLMHAQSCVNTGCSLALLLPSTPPLHAQMGRRGGGEAARHAGECVRWVLTASLHARRVARVLLRSSTTSPLPLPAHEVVRALPRLVWRAGMAARELPQPEVCVCVAPPAAAPHGQLRVHTPARDPPPSHARPVSLTARRHGGRCKRTAPN